MSKGRFAIVVLAVVVALVLWRVLALASANTVVVYVSHDQVFSEPILQTRIQNRAPGSLVSSRAGP